MLWSSDEGLRGVELDSLAWRRWDVGVSAW